MRLIVVGSGIVGAACAHEATSLGAEVVLLDAGTPGQATAAGAGIICPWSSSVEDQTWHSFASAAAKEYPHLTGRLAELGEKDFGYQRVGALALVSNEADQKQVRNMLMARRRQAPEIGDVHNVSGAEAQRMFPALRADAAAVYIGGAARVDGQQLADALTRVAVRAGAVVRTGEASLVCRSGRVVGVRVGGQLVVGDAVVAATGAWTRSFLHPAGLSVQMESQRGQTIHISLRSVDTSRWPVVLSDAGGYYALAFAKSRIVCGATRESGVGLDYRVTPGGLAEILSQTLAFAPGLASGTYLEARVGFRPMGPDMRPLLGPVAGLEGLVVATGLGAFGLTMGPYAGKVAAQVAIGLPSPISLEPFDPLRNHSSHA